NNNHDNVDTIFNAFKDNYLKGTIVSDLQFKRISGGYLQTDKIDVPILLITKQSCFITHREEIKAINEMANKYKGKLKTIVLFWDRRGSAKKASKGYNRNVDVVYVNERDNKLNLTLSSLKNAFGTPASFYITENKELTNIDRKFYLKNIKRDTKKAFYEGLYSDITQLLLENEMHRTEREQVFRGQ
ncbi:MAG TPA: hypothetical protein PKI08_07030, partial [Aquaticitalea sp.]|nr:hypothetical protein [Aquaticitalea sp.]